MKQSFLKCLLAIVLTCGASVGFAADAANAKQDLPPTLQSLSQKWGLTILKRFDTDIPGITGFVVKGRNGRSAVLYSYKNVVMAGSIYNADGENLAKKYAEANMPKPDFADAVTQLKQDPHLITEGKSGAPEIYAFADPNCIYCHKFWQQTRDWVKAGKVQIHWVMVGFLKESSPGKAAAMMAAKDGAKAIADDEMHFNVDKEEGSIQPLKTIPDELTQALRQHEEMMARLEFNGTPSLIFKSAKGEWVGVGGLPKREDLAKQMGIQN
ncbi:thiol:disulfide interchange protein DsbG [Mangrovitalea sediminis]|uniref:thiol:disulfide interchange protein DsbG n=1 Tax=Mangrovitalea sediminis TaxID=1982043 RepID=UPI000BE59327|nr:thiol:disulfide interchange protein DsbG [Mangrovitalea sediminis]